MRSILIISIIVVLFAGCGKGIIRGDVSYDYNAPFQDRLLPNYDRPSEQRREFKNIMERLIRGRDKDERWGGRVYLQIPRSR